MKKSSKSKNKAGAALRVDPYLEGLMAKLLEHLVGIEKKLDTVITQTAGKLSVTGAPSKPFQSPEAKQPPRRDRVLYEAICADCHKVCEVPFRPSEDRPVYCKECFARRKSGVSGKNPIVLTPVALAPKPKSQLGVPATSIPPVRETAKKAKKNPLKKKAKKK